MSKIQADEISSIIKERIDNFESNPDGERGITINIPWVPKYCVQAAIMQLSSAMVCISGQCSGIAKRINDLAVAHENVYPILKDRKHEKYGWYRKFEKKRF